MLNTLVVEEQTPLNLFNHSKMNIQLTTINFLTGTNTTAPFRLSSCQTCNKIKRRKISTKKDLTVTLHIDKQKSTTYQYTHQQDCLPLTIRACTASNTISMQYGVVSSGSGKDLTPQITSIQISAKSVQVQGQAKKKVVNEVNINTLCRSQW